MNENKVFDIVKKIFSKDEINHMAESLIIKSDIGYELYNKYCITKKDNRFQVIKFPTLRHYPQGCLYWRSSKCW